MKMFGQVKKYIASGLLAGVMIVLFFAVAYAVDVMIDAFNGVTQSITVNSGTPSASNATVDGASLGGERDFEATWVSGSDVTLASNSGAPANGALTFSSATGTQGRGTVTFDGADGAPTTLDPDGLCTPTCPDLTDSGANTHMRIRVVENDLASTAHFRIYNGTTNNPADYIEYALSLPGGIAPGEAVDFLMPYTGFSTFGAGANANNAGAVQIFFNQGAPTTALDVALDFFDSTDAGLDLGDLPNSYAMTTIAQNGARHQLTTGLRLGGDRDGEADGVPSALANGDDTASLSDEAGVVRSDLNGPWNSTNGGTVQVSVQGCSGTCRLNGWIDWDDSGDFTGPNEVIINNAAVGNSNSFYSFSIPVGSFPGTNQDVYARFRVCQNGQTCNTVTGSVATGEVEDYFWTFTPTAVTLQDMAVSSSPTLAVSLLVGVLLLVVLSGTVLWARRRAA